MNIFRLVFPPPCCWLTRVASCYAKDLSKESVKMHKSVAVFVLISFPSAFCRQSSWKSRNSLNALKNLLSLVLYVEDRHRFEWDTLDRCLSRVRHTSQLFYELNLRAEIKRRTAQFEGSKRKKKSSTMGSVFRMKVMKKRTEFFFPSPPIRKTLLDLRSVREIIKKIRNSFWKRSGSAIIRNSFYYKETIKTKRIELMKLKSV